MVVQLDIVLISGGEDPNELQPEVFAVISSDPPYIIRYNYFNLLFGKPTHWTEFDENTTYIIHCKEGAGYKFHHVEITGVNQFFYVKDFSINVTSAMQDQAIRIYYTDPFGNEPKVTGQPGEPAAQFVGLTVKIVPNEAPTTYSNLALVAASKYDAREDCTVRFEYSFRNVSSDQQSHGYRFALMAVSDEPDQDEVMIYDPLVGSLPTDYNYLQTLNHEIRLGTYSAVVTMKILGTDSENNSMIVIDPVKMRIETGTPYAHSVDWPGDDDGDNMFWVYALIVLIIMISVFGVSKWKKWI